MRLPAVLLAIVVALPLCAREKEGSSDVVRAARIVAEAAQRKKSAEAWEARKRVAAVTSKGSPAVVTSSDVGNIAVLQDDGTLINPANPFALSNTSILFMPANGSYTVSGGSSQFLNSGAFVPPLTLADDDTKAIALPFAFPFFGQSYSTIFLNSDGNLTFGAGDVEITTRDLGRFLAGRPRIAPFFADLNPSEGGAVTAGMSSSLAVFTWTAVPYCCTETLPSPVATQTFQVVLYADGRIQINYGTVQGQSAIVGISPGGASNGSPASFSAIDFAKLSNTASGPATGGISLTPSAVGEVFASAPVMCVSCVSQRFFATHEDAYDELFVWSEIAYNFSGGFDVFAESNEIRNDATGIGGLDNSSVVFDNSREAGAVNGRLQALVEMGQPSKYPADPTARVPSVGENTTLSILAHEFGHRWLAYALYSGTTALLGRANAHWSFYFNTQASVLEGNQIQDNGDGTFTTTKAVSQYSPLDRYLMGLIPPEQVPDTFLVTNAVSLYPAAYAPTTGASISGARTPVTIAQIIQSNGPRLPASAFSPKAFNSAFVLVIPQGASADPSHVAQLDSYRAPFEAFFSTATGGTGTLHTTLLKSARILPLPLVAGSSTTTVAATLTLQSAAPAGGATFQVQSSDATIAKVPAAVTVPSGATTAAFPIIMGLAGTATITATSPGYETISGTVASTTGAVVNAANFAAGFPVTPGSIASFFGPFLTSSTAAATALPLPTTLAGASLSVNGTPVPLFFASAGQINFQVPFELLGSYANLVITRAAQPSLTLPLLLTSASPGLFTVSASGAGPIVALDAITQTPVNIAHSGQILSIFATGLGAVFPAISSGVAAGSAPLSQAVGSLTATIGGQSAAVGYAGLAPGFVGLYQLNLTIPSTASGPDLPVVVTINGAASNAPTLTVR